MDILDKLQRDYDTWWEEQWQIHYGVPPVNKQIVEIYRLLNETDGNILAKFVRCID